MARQLFYPKMEILSKDFNALRNSMEIALFERFMGESLPSLPAFIGSGLRPGISGASVVLSPGIGFQEAEPGDGSTKVRLINLEAETTLSPQLAAAGQTKSYLIQARSILKNNPMEDRSYKAGEDLIEERPTLVSNQWSAEVSSLENPSQDANGNYVPAVGFAPVALVVMDDTGIQALTDLRNFFNLFEPSFFNTYGRRNISFSRKYDGVNLIEAPFNFSAFVSKISQISVRKFSRELYSLIAAIPPKIFRLAFGFRGGISQRIAKQNFLGGGSVDLTVNNRNVGLSSYNNRIGGSSFRGRDDDFEFSIDFSSEEITSFWIDDLTSSAQAALSRTNAPSIFVMFWKSSISAAPSANNAVVYEISQANRRLSNENLYNLASTRIAPIFKSENISSQFDRISVSTVNPVSGGSIFTFSGAAQAIRNFYTFEDVQYNQSSRKFSFTLKDTSITQQAGQWSPTRNPAKDLSANIRMDHLTEDATKIWVIEDRNQKYYLRSIIKATGALGPENVDLNTLLGTNFGYASTRNLSLGAYTFISADDTHVWICYGEGSNVLSKIRAIKKSDLSLDSTKSIDLAYTAHGFHTDNDSHWIKSYPAPTHVAYTYRNGRIYQDIRRYNINIRNYNKATKAYNASKSFSGGSYLAVYGSAAYEQGMIGSGDNIWVSVRSGTATAGSVTWNPIRGLLWSGFSKSTGSGTNDIDLGTLFSFTTGQHDLSVYDGVARLLQGANNIIAADLESRAWTGSFPDNVFNRLLVKKGNAQRLALQYSDLTVEKTENKATFSKVLTSLENLILDSDSAYGDFSIEFLRGGSSAAGEAIWRANELRRGTDFTVVEEGQRTYIRLNSNYPWVTDDQILISHIVPQELIEGRVGGRENLEDQINALQLELEAVKNKNRSQDSEIATLAGRTGGSASTTVYWGFGAKQAAGSRDVASVSAEARAGWLVTAARMSKATANLAIGALIDATAPAAAGFYHFWVALPQGQVDELRIRGADGSDDTSEWVMVTGNFSVGAEPFSLYARRTPFIHAEEREFIFRSYT